MVQTIQILYIQQTPPPRLDELMQEAAPEATLQYQQVLNFQELPDTDAALIICYQEAAITKTTFASIPRQLLIAVPLILITPHPQPYIQEQWPAFGFQDYLSLHTATASQVKATIHAALGRIACLRQLAQETNSQAKSTGEHTFPGKSTLEELVASISTEFISLRADGLDRTIDKSLELVGRVVDVDRVYIFLYHTKAATMSCMYEWCGEGISVEKDNLKDLPIDLFPWWNAQQHLGNIINLFELDDLPPQAVQEKEILEAQYILSLLVMPLTFEGRAIGFVGYDSVKHHRRWVEKEIRLLKSFSEIISNALKRREYESELKKHGFESIFFATVDLHAILDHQGEFLMVNKSWETELSEKELVEKYIWDFLPSVAAGQMKQQWQEMLDLSESRFLVTEWVGTTGEKRLMEWKMVPDENSLVIMVARDITTRQEVENQLALAGERLRLATQAAKQGVWEWDIKNNHLIWDEYMFELYGVLESEFSSNLEDWLLTIHPDDRDEQVQEVSKTLEDGLGVFDTAFRIIKYGEIRHLLGKGMLLFDENKQPDRLIGINWDVTNEHLTRQKLRQSEEKYRALVNNLSEVVFQTTPDGRWVFLSQAWERCMGYAVEDTLQRQVEDFLMYPEEDSLGLHHQIQTIKDERLLNVKIEVRFRHKNGHKCWMEVFANAIEEQGKVVGIVGTMLDISAQKKAQKELHLTEQRFSAIFHSSIHFIGLMEPDGRMIEVNQTAMRFAGHADATSIIGKPFWEGPWWRHKPELIQQLRKSVEEAAQGKTVRYDMEVIGVHDIVRTIDFSIKPMYDQGGKVYMLIPEGRDITEILQTQQKLATNENILRELTENVDEIFWVHSKRPFRLLFVNRMYEEILGRTRQELYDDPLSCMADIAETHRQLAQDTLMRYVAGESIDEEFLIVPPAQSPRWIRLRTFNITNEDGQIVRQMGIATNISDRKEKELMLQNALEQEKELNRQKSQFVATASHQFRTPLTSIQSSVEILKLLSKQQLNSPPDLIGHYLQVIEGEIIKFRELMTDILTLGSIENGKVPFTPNYHHVVQICREIVESYFMHEEECRIVCHFPEEEIPIFCDQKLIRHCVMNLLSNAVKFSNGKVELTIEFDETEVSIRIKDQGIGIDELELPFLFDSFYRAKNATNIQGTGLGLTITKQFVEIHEGKIYVESVLNQGTCFTIVLPILPIHENPPMDQSLLYV
ncbi:PAS domain S-box protein [Arundinibacter roseus]|uniref:histidine kinase n=1 Tax=Arundinibacter roseus TaxID=2070510 RepID=A0A4R4KLF9_9BACT|nr:PAS domain S-box protein [Arundinibacter roseus]TDB69200.1 PAS domain S-box protein [Arundinibacter roseus]